MRNLVKWARWYWHRAFNRTCGCRTGNPPADNLHVRPGCEEF